MTWNSIQENTTYRFKESPKLQTKISLKMLLSLEKSSTCTSVSPSDIDICHRMGPRNSSGPKPIIVRFKSHKKKTELYKARKHLKSVSLNQYFHATNMVYVNENGYQRLL